MEKHPARGQSGPRHRSQGHPVMVTLRDCLGLSELAEDEVHLIAEHEHIPEIVAAELGSELLQSTDGVTTLKAYILDCVEHARRARAFDRADALYAIYRRFDATHPTPTSH
jgi:hypothetical protein